MSRRGVPGFSASMGEGDCVRDPSLLVEPQFVGNREGAR
jgi:hypothetical protein